MTTHTTRLDLIREAIGDRRPTEPISWVHDLAHAIDAALPPDPHTLAEDRIRAAVLAEDAKQREGVGR